MDRPRVGDAQLGGGTPATPGSGGSRVSRALASPLAILFVVPGLVALVGMFLTFTGDRALRGSNLDGARDRLSEQTRLVAANIRQVLAQAEPVLDRLAARTRAHDPSQPFESFAHVLVDLVQGRPGIAYVSASFPDGTFQGAYVDDDGTLRFQDSRVEPAGTRVRRYDFAEGGTLALRLEERTAYDPRERSFYRLALESGKRVWTPPYPFYMTHYTGVTRTEPVYVGHGADKRLHAVITVDFDVNVLSSYLRDRQRGGGRAVLFARDGTLLAYPSGAPRIAKLPLRADRTLHYRDLGDPVLESFFARAESTAGTSELALFPVETGRERFLAAVAPASQDPALGWFVAYLADEADVFRSLRAYERRSLAIAGIAVALAVLAGGLFALHIVRVRREAAEARAAAREARLAARELGSYRLVSCLGKGGMGEVWKAEHRLLAREAAIKLINPEVASALTLEARARFRREAETLASLRSRHTIELFDYGVSDDGTFFYVMELLDGMDLDTLVKRHGAQPAARVIHFLLQALSSLAEAHDAGLVHRDIKPANLFVCRAADEVDVIKGLDFGLVRGPGAGRATGLDDPRLADVQTLADTITQSGGLMGTPAYMAPEQIAGGHAVDARTDLYALGCVAFFLLTGRKVFDEESTHKLLAAHVHAEPPRLASVVHGYCPSELDALVRACLEKSPAHRPSSARALIRALRAIDIPAEHAWTDDRAQAWWAEHRPRPRSFAPPSVLEELTIIDARGPTLTRVE